MRWRIPTRSPICWLALLLAVAPAAAESPTASDGDRSSVAFAPDFGEEHGFVGRCETHAFGRLGIFALGREHGFDPRTSVFDLEGGARLALAGPLSLAGGYRLLGYEFKPSDGSLTSQLRGAFVALELDF